MTKFKIGDIVTVTTNITLQKKNGETLHMNGRSGRVVFIFTNYDGETVYLIEIDDFIEIVQEYLSDGLDELELALREANPEKDEEITNGIEKAM